MSQRGIQWMSRNGLRRLAIALALLIPLLAWGWRTVMFMPGTSYQGALPPLTATEQALQQELQRDVAAIATQEHNFIFYQNLQDTADFLESAFAETGFTPQRQSYTIQDKRFDNIEVEIPGATKPEEIVVVGAHYDSVFNSPGANDNGTGTAAVLALARRFAQQTPDRTLRFVAFVNEEPPFFWTEDMGSLVYAKRCRDRNENIVAMLSLETLGYYSDAPGSQQYPLGLMDRVYPMQGNFVGFVSNQASSKLLRQAIASFRRHTQFPSEGAVLPGDLPGVGWSDHWAFWQQGYPGIMLTDTATFRYPHYHTPEDTPDKVNYESLARVVAGIERMIVELAKESFVF